MKLLTRRRHEPAADVYRVTDARRAHSEDQHSRVTRYLVSMTVRMVCLGLALVVPSPWFWICVAGAVVLPYVAVVAANAGVENKPGPVATVAPPAPRAIEGHRQDDGTGGGH